MMRFGFFLLTLFGLLSAAGFEAGAQIDSSSAMLLNSSTRVPVRDGGLDSGRYTVRPKAANPKPHLEPTALPVATPAPVVTPAVTPTLIPTPTPFPAPIYCDDVELGEPQAVPIAPKISKDDRRTSMLELSFAPGYIYNESKSTFAPRTYFLNAPVMSVDANVWLSRHLGIRTNFTGTYNANVTDSLDNTRNTSAADQWFSIGARTRSFFGDGPTSSILRLGLDYREFEFKVPSDARIRNKLATSGLIFLVEGEIPSSESASWIFGADVGPYLRHRETSNAVAMQTGTDVTTTSVGAHIGARYRFDRSQSLYWKISYAVEKNLFSGSTSIPDPVTGSSQSNVSVTNSFSMFQLGFTWAD